MNITSLQNPLVKHLVKLQTDKKYRQEQKRVVIEGKKMVAEVCSKAKTYTALAIEEALFPKADEQFLVTEQVMQKVCGSKTPEGVVAEVAMPSPQTLTGSHILALENVSDPGNLGTLFRTALALGWKGIFLLPGCADPFNDKSLRSAKGATFRLPFTFGTWEELEELVAKEQLEPLVADMGGKELPKVSRPLLLLGGEARGVSQKALKTFTPVAIPMAGEMESLNVAVAGAILMQELRP